MLQPARLCIATQTVHICSIVNINPNQVGERDFAVGVKVVLRLRSRRSTCMRTEGRVYFKSNTTREI